MKSIQAVVVILVWLWSSAFAEETKHFTQLTGAAARVLFQALSKTLPRKNNRIEFSRIECGSESLAEDNDCKNCKHSQQRKAEQARFCDVNKKHYQAKDTVTPDLTAALKGITTGVGSPSGDKTLKAIRSGFCTTERAHFYCSYDYYTHD